MDFGISLPTKPIKEKPDVIYFFLTTGSLQTFPLFSYLEIFLTSFTSDLPDIILIFHNVIDPAEEIEGEDIYDLPWNAMHFMIDEKPFTVSYLSHPSNPDNVAMSERLYGRFGEFFPMILRLKILW